MLKQLASIALNLFTLPMQDWTRILASERPAFAYLFIGISGLLAAFLYLLKNVDGVSHLLIAYLVTNLAMIAIVARKPHLVLTDADKIQRMVFATSLERLNFGCLAALVVVPLMFIQLAAATLALSAIFPAVNALGFTTKIGVACAALVVPGYLLNLWVGRAKTANT